MQSPPSGLEKDHAKAEARMDWLEGSFAEKNLEVLVGRGLNIEPADCWPATDSCILSSTSKTGQEVFPFIWHPWGHILQFGVLHCKENIDRVLQVHWRAPR